MKFNFSVAINAFFQQPLSPEVLHAHMNDDNTSLVVNNSNSAVGKTATTAEALKENESDTSNDDLEQQTSQSIARIKRTNGNNSDEASGYFTEERVNTSVEDVSTLVLPPITRDYSSSSDTDSNSNSNSNLELKLGLNDDPPITNTAKTKLKTSEMLVNRSDNTIKPRESS